MQQIIRFKQTTNIPLSNLIDMENHSYFFALINQDSFDKDVRHIHPAFQYENIRKDFLDTSSIEELKNVIKQLYACCVILNSNDIQEVRVMSIDSKYYLLQSLGFNFPRLEFNFVREYRGDKVKYKSLSSQKVDDLIIHSSISNATSSIIVDAKECYTDYVFDIYEVNSFYDILFLEYFFLLKEKKNIKHCKKCNRLFLSNCKEDLFCQSPVNNPTCVEEQKETERKKEIQAIYRRLYKTYFEQTRTGKLEKELFENWREKTKEYRKFALKNRISTDSFKQWTTQNPPQ